jgi:hypothetical protein
MWDTSGLVCSLKIENWSPPEAFMATLIAKFNQGLRILTP